MSSHLPPSWQAFIASIREFKSYPENVVHKTTYLDALKTYKIQLDDIEKKLFVTRDEDVNVPIRDLIDPGQDVDLLDSRTYNDWCPVDFERIKIHNDSELQERLGVASRADPDLAKIRPDPKCRFMWVLKSFLTRTNRTCCWTPMNPDLFIQIIRKLHSRSREQCSFASWATIRSRQAILNSSSCLVSTNILGNRGLVGFAESWCSRTGKIQQ